MFRGPAVWNCLDAKPENVTTLIYSKEFLKHLPTKQHSFIKGTYMNCDKDHDNFVYV